MGSILGIPVGAGVVSSKLGFVASLGTVLIPSCAAAGDCDWVSFGGGSCCSCRCNGGGEGGKGGGGGDGGVSSSISARSVPRVGAPSCGVFAGVATAATPVAPCNMATPHPMLRIVARAGWRWAGRQSRLVWQLRRVTPAQGRGAGNERVRERVNAFSLA